ncbi:MAG TPA: hypothetical protein VMS86_13920 [Thermoanaerobaculia bacterium]|nr:hypothetical protein [Thermoanaerobaculia bacterium]
MAIVAHLRLIEIGPEEALGAVRRLESSTASRGAETFDFSPDGKHVAFSTARDVRSRIFLVEGLLEREP